MTVAWIQSVRRNAGLCLASLLGNTDCKKAVNHIPGPPPTPNANPPTAGEFINHVCHIGPVLYFL